MITANLKPTNQSLVKGCPGVPKTYPTIQGILEIRSDSSSTQQHHHLHQHSSQQQQLAQPQPQQQQQLQQILINSLKIKFITTDTLKAHKPRDVPNTQTKVNYEINTPINQRLIAMDVPFILPIHQSITSTNNLVKSSTNHYIQVEITYNSKTYYRMEFPVVITTYDNLPIYRQFNEPITKVLDSKDLSLLIEYSLPSIAIGPMEELIFNLKISKNTHTKQSSKKLRLRRITVQIVENFDVRCDKSFIKENIIKSINYPIETDLNSKNFIEQFKVQLNDLNPTSAYEIFLKHKDLKTFNKQHNSSIDTKKNELKPTIIDMDASNPIPLTHINNYYTFKSNFFSYYYEIRVQLRYNSTSNFTMSQPFNISPFDRIKSIELIKWILKESELAMSYLNEIEKENGSKLKYDSKFDVLSFPQPKPLIMKNKEDKDKFL